MSLTFKPGPPRYDAGAEPHTYIMHDGRECGIIVHDEDEGVYDVWVSVKKRPEDQPGPLTWKWLHFKETPALLRKAQELATSRYDKLTAQYQLHYTR